MFDRLMNCIWLDESKGFKDGMSFWDIDVMTYTLIAEREQNKGRKNTFKSVLLIRENYRAYYGKKW